MSDFIRREDAFSKFEKACTCDSVDKNGMKRGEIKTALTWEGIRKILENIPSAEPDNQVHLCDSCHYSYPVCPTMNNDVIFGNGIGHDNICACAKFEIKPEQTVKVYHKQAPDNLKGYLEESKTMDERTGNGKWIEIKRTSINPLTGKHGVYLGCSECGTPIPTDNQLDSIDESDVKYCLFCGAKMENADE